MRCFPGSYREPGNGIDGAYGGKANVGAHQQHPPVDSAETPRLRLRDVDLLQHIVLRAPQSESAPPGKGVRLGRKEVRMAGRLAFRELEPFAGSRLTVLFPLHFTGVAC